MNNYGLLQKRRELLNKTIWGFILIFFLGSILCFMYHNKNFYVLYHFIAIALGIVVYKTIMCIGEFYLLGKNK